MDISIEQIIKECEERNIDVCSDFVTFLTSLVKLSLTSQCSIYENEKSIESKIRSTVIDKLLDQSEPALVTFKLQFHFARHYCVRDFIIRQYRNKIHQKILPLIKEICEVNSLENVREIERLYQKMLVVITVLSGLGNPTIPTVLREVGIAMQSVLQPSELPRYYVTLSMREKEQQLTELAFIVAGIRIFNRDCQRGGEGIDDLPSILQTGMNRTRSTIIRLLEILMKKVYQFTACVDFAMQNHFYDWKDGPEYKKVLWTIEMLVATRQQEIYVRKLLSDLELCEDEIKCLVNRLQNRLAQLHETVKYRTAIPTTQVYPQFADIADIWLKLQDEVIVLSYINDMIWQLQNLFPKPLSSEQQSILKEKLRYVQVLTDAERLEQTMGKFINECGDCSVAYPSSDTNFDKLNLQFLGFCAWSFVVGKGALIPGNPNIGVVEWDGKCFAFSSVDAAQRFGKCPYKYMFNALKIIRNRQEYIHLFQLYNDIQLMNIHEKLSGELVQLKARQDQEVQTETHVLPTYIEKNYSSSLWELRQQALQMASIYECATKSTQTVKSHFRTGMSLQTIVMPKEMDVQTMKDGSTNTKRTKKYIFGLRGRDSHVQEIDCAFNK